MLKKDYIFYDFKVTYVIDQKPPEIPSEMAGYFVYKGFMPFDICIRYPNRYPF